MTSIDDIGFTWAQIAGIAGSCRLVLTGAALPGDCGTRRRRENEHLYAIVGAVDAILERFRFNLHAGDVLLLNDPDAGGTHGPDWTLIAPVCYQGKPVLLPAVRAATTAKEEDQMHPDLRVTGARSPVQQVVVEPEGIDADRFGLRGRLMVSLHQVIAHHRPFARQPSRRDELRLRARPRRRVACAHRVVGAALARGIPDLVATQ